MNSRSATPDGAKTISIVGLGGSLRPTSSSREALKVALDGAKDAGAKVDLLDLRQLNLPMYDPSSNEVPEAVSRFVEARTPLRRTPVPSAAVRATRTAIRFAIEVPVTKSPLALSGKPKRVRIHCTT